MPDDEGTPTIEELQAQIKEKEEALERTNQELKGLKDKDLNFSKLRGTVKEEEKKLSEFEKQLLERQEKFETEQRAFAESRKTEFAEKIIEGYAGKDEELKKKIEYNFKRLGGGKTESEIQTVMGEAYLLSTGNQATVNPLRTVAGSSGASSMKVGRRNFADTEEGKLLAHKLGIKL